MSEEAQKIADELNAIHDALQDIWNSADGIAQAVAKHCVTRNGAIVSLRHKNGDDLCAAIDDLIVRNASTDATFLGAAEFHIVEISGAMFRLKEVTERFVKKWNEQAADLRASRVAIEAERAKVSDLTLRVKEHALHNPAIREQVWSITDGRCFYCDVELIRERVASDPSRTFCIDHIVAKSNGGPDHTSNYVPACQRCNLSKSSKSFVEFTSWLRQQSDEPELKVVGGTDV